MLSFTIMEYLSPQKIVLAPMVVVAHYETSFTYHEPGEEDMKRHGVLPQIYFGDPDPTIENPGMVTVTPNPPSNEVITQYIRFQSLLNTCINNAESIKQNLHIVVAHIFFKAGKKSDEVKLYDLMKLKDSFVDYLKSKAETRDMANKAFRRAFNQFVIDRNIYTHGKLSYRPSDRAFILSYLDNHTKITTHAIINKEIITSYFNAYKVFKKSIDDFHRLSR